MANAKSRLKAPKSAPTKSRGRGRPKSGLTVTKKAVKSVMRRNINGKSTVSEDKVQFLLQNGSLMKEITNEASKSKIEVMLNSRLMSKSGRIRKKSKDHLKLIDNILKSELMIEDIKARAKASSANNNNDSETSDQNETVSSSNSIIPKNNVKKTAVEPNKKLKKNMRCKSKTTEKKSSKCKTMVNNDLLPLIPVFQCHDCGKTFNTKSSISRHMYIHLNLKTHKCNVCSKKYRKKSNLQAHMRQRHLDTVPASQSEPQYEMCHICDTTHETLSTHLSTHIGNDNFLQCVYCDKKFSNHVILVQHEKQHLVNGGFQCTICNMSYSTSTLLDMHMKRHLNIKQYICQYCGKEFLRINSMRRHVQVCHAGLRIQCPICKKNLKGHLSEHMRVHENKRPHECAQCGQRFTQSTQLNVHLRSHTGDRPYPCRICDRRFSHSNALILHIRRHTGEKPFQCAMCPLFFSQLPHMKAHMRNIHRKENAYKCQNCNQFFKLKAHLEKHITTCVIGDKEPNFQGNIEASVKSEEIEVESVMSLSRMRYLLALLLTMIATKAKLKYLGFNKRSIDDILVESLEGMGQIACKDESLTPLQRLKTNIQILLNGTVPKEQMEKFKMENKTTEDILELLTDEQKTT
ncbi:zinc finger protein 37 homolog [Galleria mellonella]|uniref:Zinc finger protein 37 homolog n=1 Tax=Galleria mellonella TaxID=7137 RepID=A0ABM3MFI4_GALME|nr:zinc finger protein 37 homolog [Galleria mellonella]